MRESDFSDQINKLQTIKSEITKNIRNFILKLAVPLSFCRLLAASSAICQIGARSPPDHERPGGSGSLRGARSCRPRKIEDVLAPPEVTFWAAREKRMTGSRLWQPAGSPGQPEVENRTGPVLFSAKYRTNYFGVYVFVQN